MRQEPIDSTKLTWAFTRRAEIAVELAAHRRESTMSIDADELRALPSAEKMRLVEMLWDDLGESTEPIPLPDWVDREGNRSQVGQ